MKTMLTALALLAGALPVAAQGAWSDPAGIPVAAWAGAAVVATDADTLYVSRGSSPGASSFSLWKHTISTGQWREMAPLSIAVTDGSTMAFRPGTPYIYFMAGERLFHRYDMSTEGTSTNPWTTLAYPTTMPRAIYGSKLVATSTTLYALLWNGFYEYNPGTNAWNTTSMAKPPGFPTMSGVGPGTSLICPGSGRYIFALIGKGSSLFSRYDTTTGAWLSLAPMPEPVDGGGAMGAGPVDAGGNFDIYAAPGYSSTRMYRFAGGSWTEAATLPGSPGAGMSMASPAAGPLLYILRGAANTVGSTDLWRYAPGDSRTLSALSPLPGLADSGGCLASVGDGQRLFAFRGGNTPDFYEYTIATGTWTAGEPAPAPVFDGGSLVWDGGDYLYATRGGGTTEFWRIDIDSVTWENLTLQHPLPLKMGVSGQLLRVGDDLYAMRGFAPDPTRFDVYGPSTQLYRYSPGAGWTLASALENSVFSTGSALAFEAGAGIRAITFDAATGAAQLRTFDTIFETWSAPVALPAGAVPGHGASLCSPGPGRPLVAMIGGGSALACTWTETDGWTALPTLPGTVGGPAAGHNSGGGSLVHPGRGPYFYALQGGSSSAFWRYGTENNAPPAPSQLQQTRLDGVTPVLPGVPINTNSFIASALVGDPDDETVVLSVEIQPVGDAFTGTATVSGAPGYGGRASVVVTLPGPGEYHWQAWTTDDRGLSSGPRSMGTHPDVAGEIDLVHVPNSAPSAAAFTMRGASTGEIAASGGRLAEDGVTFEVVVADVDGDDVRLQVEVIPGDGTFRGTPVATSAEARPGSVATVTLRDQAQGSYRVRHRVIDALDEAGAWSADASYSLIAGGSAGPLSCLNASSARSAGGWCFLFGFAALLSRRMR